MKTKASETIRRQDYMTRLSEQEGDLIKDRMVAIPESVHKRVKAASEELNQPVYESYTEALRMWLKAKGISAEIDGIGQLTAEEERIVTKVIDLYRMKEHKKIYGDTISAIKLLLRQAISD